MHIVPDNYCLLLLAKCVIFLKGVGAFGPTGAVKTRAETKMFFSLSQKCEILSILTNFTEENFVQNFHDIIQTFSFSQKSPFAKISHMSHTYIAKNGGGDIFANTF